MIARIEQPAESDAETTEPEAPTTNTPEDTADGTDEPDTFPRTVVEELRRENARYRTRAGQADDMAQRLHTELIRATNRLADPSDLPFEENHLEDVSILDAAIDDLLSRKPHLASRRPSGDIGQGATGQTDTVDLAGLLRARAG
ncbi:MAG: hypothetical protein ACR2JG_03100 [Geodermatophilaceae bacterium]